MTAMDYPHAPDEFHRAAAVPPEWTEVVSLGSEDTARDDPTHAAFVDDRFAPAGDIGSEEPAGEPACAEDEPTVTATVRQVVGDVTIADVVEISTANDAPTDDPAGQPPADQPAEVPTPADNAEQPAPGDGGDVPPEVPPIADGETDPDRGEALRQILADASGINDRVHERVRAIVIDHAEDLGLLRMLRDNTSLDEAIDSIGDTIDVETNTSILDEAIDAEVAASQERFGDLYQAAGLELYATSTYVQLIMTDPGTFTEAMEQVTPPDAETQPEERTAFDKQTVGIVLEAVHRASDTFIAGNPQAALAIGEGDVWLSAILPQVAQSVLDKDFIGFAESLAANAERLANRMDDLSSPDAAVAPIRELGLAHQDNMLTEFAIAERLHLTNLYSTSRIGIERLETPFSWESVYHFFRHLRDTNPDAAFSTAIRSHVLNDISRSVNELPNEESLTGRLILGLLEPLLRTAAANIQYILPSSD